MSNQESTATVEVNAAAPRNPSEYLLHFEQDDLVIWSLDWAPIHPFNLKDAEETALLEAWLDQAFDELLEMDAAILAVRSLRHTLNQATYLHLELRGKYQFISLDDLAVRYRKLRALLYFIANYSGDAIPILARLALLDTGELPHS